MAARLFWRLAEWPIALVFYGYAALVRGTSRQQGQQALSAHEAAET